MLQAKALTSDTQRPSFFCWQLISKYWKFEKAIWTVCLVGSSWIFWLRTLYIMRRYLRQFFFFFKCHSFIHVTNVLRLKRSEWPKLLSSFPTHSDTPEKFENSVFTLKTYRMFFRQRYSGQKKLENATITGHFGLVFAVNAGREFYMIIVMSWFL